jgi:hypothetical protein
MLLSMLFIISADSQIRVVTATGRKILWIWRAEHGWNFPTLSNLQNSHVTTQKVSQNRLVFSVFTSRCLVAASNDKIFPFLWIPERCPASATSFSLVTTATLNRNQNHCQCYVTTDGQSANVPWCQAPIWDPRADFYYCKAVSDLLMWGALSDEKTGVSFTIPAGLRQRSHSWVRVLRDSWPYFTVSDSRHPQPGGPGPRITIPQEQGGPVIPPGIVFSFRHLLRHAGLWWR